MSEGASSEPRTWTLETCSVCGALLREGSCPSGRDARGLTQSHRGGYHTVRVRVVEQQSSTEGSQPAWDAVTTEPATLYSTKAPESPEHQPDECARGTKGCDIEHEPDDEGPCFGTEPEPWDPRTVAAVVELLREHELGPGGDWNWNHRLAPSVFIESHPRFKAPAAAEKAKPEMTNWERRQVEGWADGTGPSS